MVKVITKVESENWDNLHKQELLKSPIDLLRDLLPFGRKECILMGLLILHLLSWPLYVRYYDYRRYPTITEPYPVILINASSTVPFNAIIFVVTLISPNMYHVETGLLRFDPTGELSPYNVTHEYLQTKDVFGCFLPIWTMHLINKTNHHIDVYCARSHYHRLTHADCTWV